jgi:hypothetical protein
VPGGNVSLVTNLQGPAGPGSVVTLGAGALTNGAFTGSFVNLPGGLYNVTAHYPGDQNFQASDSNAVAVTVSKEGSTTSLVTALSLPYGEEFQPLHTIVTGVSGQGHASGTMIFSDGGTQLGTVPLNIDGQADFLPSGPLTLTVGTHTLGASYSGDNSFTPSTAQPMTITITKAMPVLAIDTFFTFTGAGAASVLVLNTGPILPTGTVQLFEAGKALGNPVSLVPVNGLPTANFSGFPSTAGIHDFSVSYSGDNVYQSTSFNFQVAIFSPFAFDPAQNSSLSATVSAGQTATYNLVVSAENGFSGTVALACSGAPAGTTCSASPVSASLPTDSSSVPVTVTVATTLQAQRQGSPFKTMFFAIAVAITALPFGRSRKRLRPAFLMVCAIILMAAMSSCGGSSTPPNPVNGRPSTSILTITGISNGASNNGASNSVQLQLTITH